MENMSKSQRGCLIAVGVLGVITLLTVIAAFILFQKAKNVVEDYADALGASPEMIEEAKSLSELYPFEEPEDNVITEAQLQRFIAVKKEFAYKIKDHESELKVLEDSKAEGQTGFREFRHTLKILAEIRRDFLDALAKHEMSPKEYRFLSEEIYRSYFGSLIENIQYDSLKAGESGTEIHPQNIDLLNKYREQLQEVETLGFEFWGFGMFGQE